MDLPRVWGVTLPVPLIFILLNILIRPQKYETMHINRVYAMYLCYILLAFFLLNVIYVIFYLMAVELQESQYLSQQRYITESSRQRHDFRQQLFSMAQNRDFEALSRHLSECISAMPDSVTTYCTNVPVNAPLPYSYWAV